MLTVNFVEVWCMEYNGNLSWSHLLLLNELLLLWLQNLTTHVRQASLIHFFMYLNTVNFYSSYLCLYLWLYGLCFSFMFVCFGVFLSSNIFMCFINKVLCYCIKHTKHKSRSQSTDFWNVTKDLSTYFWTMRSVKDKYPWQWFPLFCDSVMREFCCIYAKLQINTRN